MSKQRPPEIDIEKPEFRRVPSFVLVNAREMFWLAIVAGTLAIIGAWAGFQRDQIWVVFVALFLAGVCGAFLSGAMVEGDLRKMGIKPVPGGKERIDDDKV